MKIMLDDGEVLYDLQHAEWLCRGLNSLTTKVKHRSSSHYVVEEVGSLYSVDLGRVDKHDSETLACLERGVDCDSLMEVTYVFA